MSMVPRSGLKRRLSNRLEEEDDFVCLGKSKRNQRSKDATGANMFSKYFSGLRRGQENREVHSNCIGQNSCVEREARVAANVVKCDLGNEDALLRLRLQLGEISQQEAHLQQQKVALTKAIKRLTKKMNDSVNDRKYSAKLEGEERPLSTAMDLLFGSKRKPTSSTERVTSTTISSRTCALWSLAQLSGGEELVDGFDENRHAILPSDNIIDTHDDNGNSNDHLNSSPSVDGVSNFQTKSPVTLSDLLNQYHSHLHLTARRNDDDINSDLGELSSISELLPALDIKKSLEQHSSKHLGDFFLSFLTKCLKNPLFLEHWKASEICQAITWICVQTLATMRTSLEENDPDFSEKANHDDYDGQIGVTPQLVHFDEHLDERCKKSIRDQWCIKFAIPPSPGASLLSLLPDNDDSNSVDEIKRDGCEPLHEQKICQSKRLEITSDSSIDSTQGLLEGGVSCLGDCSQSSLNYSNPSIGDSMEKIEEPNDDALMDFIDLYDSVHYDATGNLTTGRLFYCPSQKFVDQDESTHWPESKESRAVSPPNLSSTFGSTVSQENNVGELDPLSPCYSPRNNSQLNESLCLPPDLEEKLRDPIVKPDFDHFSKDELELISKYYGLKQDTRQKMISILQMMWRRIHQR